MILRSKDGSCIAAGKATKNGSEITYVGDKQTAKFSVGIKVKSEKGQDGQWHAEFLNCTLWGDQAEEQPKIAGGDMVFAAGTRVVRSWTGQDGSPRTSEELRCDFITSSGKNSVPGGIPGGYSPPAGGDEVDGAFAEIGEEDGELPF